MTLNKESDSPWRDALDDCEYILNRKSEGGHYKHSRSIRDFVESIRDWIQEKQHVTDKQLASIYKIKNFGGR